MVFILYHYRNQLQRFGKPPKQLYCSMSLEKESLKVRSSKRDFNKSEDRKNQNKLKTNTKKLKYNRSQKNITLDDQDNDANIPQSEVLIFIKPNKICIEL